MRSDVMEQKLACMDELHERATPNAACNFGRSTCNRCAHR